MRHAIVSIIAIALLAGGAYAVSTVAGKGGARCGSSSQAGVASPGTECEAGVATGDGACAPSSSQIAGNFDPLMLGACRFACATKLAYDAKEVLAQPGAVADRLTQCPVSGVVFAVEPSRPRVRLGEEEYATCCATCAGKLRSDPRRYIRGSRGQPDAAGEGVPSIQLVSFGGCPNTAAARAVLHEVMASAGIHASIEEVNLDSPATPESVRGWGSPTILVNGRDVGGLEAPAGTACRIYRDEAGRVFGFPPAELLRAALVTKRMAKH